MTSKNVSSFLGGGEDSDRDRGFAGLGERIASLCRREGIVANLYYRWSKEFLEAGKKRLLGDTQREASSNEAAGLRKENARLKELVAETVLENRLLKKSVTGSGLLEDEG